MAVHATDSSAQRSGIYWLLGINTFFFIACRLIAAIDQESIGWLASAELPGSFSLLMSRPWAIVTYMFLQYDFSHFAVNMLWLYLFGVLLSERARVGCTWLIYLVGGIAGGVAFILANRHSSTTLCGSSAAVLSIVTATALTIPKERIKLAVFGLVEIRKIALLVLIIMIIGVSMRNLGGFAAHLGGIAAGLAIGVALRHRHATISPAAATKSNSNKLPKELLAKLRRSGYSSLTAEERQQLFDSSKRP